MTAKNAIQYAFQEKPFSYKKPHIALNKPGTAQVDAPLKDFKNLKFTVPKNPKDLSCEVEEIGTHNNQNTNGDTLASNDFELTVNILKIEKGDPSVTLKNFPRNVRDCTRYIRNVYMLFAFNSVRVALLSK